MTPSVLRRSGPDFEKREAAHRERIDYLEAEVDRLNRIIGAAATDEQIAVVRRRLGIFTGPARVLLILLSGGAGRILSKEALLNGYCGHKMDQPGIRVIDVQIHHLRRALRPHGITIENIYGTGYRLAPDMRARIEALVFTRKRI